MSLASALAIWGRAETAAALAEPSPTPLDAAELAAWAARAAASSPDALRSWSHGLPWANFCRLVRVVAGAELQDLLDQSEGS